MGIEIRSIDFTVRASEISPSSEQNIGMQTEHAVTKINFILDLSLCNLLNASEFNNSLKYRFDCYDSIGGCYRTAPVTLAAEDLASNSARLSYIIGNELTRYGGKARVHLVITALGLNNNTAAEFISRPARLRLENLPEGFESNIKANESLTALTLQSQAAALAAQASSEEAAAIAQSVRNDADAGLFDGKDGADGKDGINGTNGKDGIDGKDGINGVDGKDGKDGAPGPRGFSGLFPIVDAMIEMRPIPGDDDSTMRDYIIIQANAMNKTDNVLPNCSSFLLGDPESGYDNEWDFVIKQGAVPYEVALPVIKWGFGIAPTFAANTTTICRLYYAGNTLCGEWVEV